jgi:hypothetical protein
MSRTATDIDGGIRESGGQTLVTESTPATSSDTNQQPDESQSPPEDATLDMRGEVNAYAGAILGKLLTIVNTMPGRQRREVRGIEREIHQMLAFIDPQQAAELEASHPLATDVDAADEPQPDDSVEPVQQADDRIEALLRQLEQSDLQRETTVELLRDLRAAIYTLREDLRSQHDATAEALQSLTATTRSLHYTITALSARSEQVTDLAGVAEEQLRVGVWKYALIAGLSSGALVAAIVVLINLVN